MGLKIIHISGLPESPLTVDSTLITADSTLITADQTVTMNTIDNNHVLSVIPREYAEEVRLVMWNEMTSVSTQIDHIFTTPANGHLEIPFSHYFIEGDSAETKVFNMDDKLIWRGKIYATSQTDLENFTLNPKNPNNVIKI